MSLGVLIGVAIETLLVWAVCATMLSDEYKNLADDKQSTNVTKVSIFFIWFWAAWRGFLTYVCMKQYFNWG